MGYFVYLGAQGRALVEDRALIWDGPLMSKTKKAFFFSVRIVPSRENTGGRDTVKDQLFCNAGTVNLSLL